MHVYVFIGSIILIIAFNILKYLNHAAVFCPGFQKGRVPSEKGTVNGPSKGHFSAVNGPSKGHFSAVN